MSWKVRFNNSINVILQAYSLGVSMEFGEKKISL